MATNENEVMMCSAQRHMDIEFFAYNSMLATAKAGQNKREGEGKPRGELIYSGSIFKLANKINRTDTQTSKAVEKLVHAGWLVVIQEQRRNALGVWSTAQYRVVEHSEFARTHECPPEKYVKVKGERWTLAKPGKAAPGLRRANMRRLVKLDLPDAWLDMLADAIEAKKAERARADTGNPVPVPDTGNPATVTAPTQEILCPPTQEILPRTDTGNPVVTDTGNPATRFALGFASNLSAPPTDSPAPTGAATKGEGREVCVSTPKAQWADVMANLSVRMKETEPSWFAPKGTPRPDAELRELIAEYGPLAVCGAVRHWWPGDTKWYWKDFVLSAHSYLGNGGAAKFAAAEKNRRWAESPEGIAEIARRQEILNEKTFAEMAFGTRKPDPFDDPNYDPMAELDAANAPWEGSI